MALLQSAAAMGDYGRMSTGYRVLHAADAFWRPSNATGVLNTDLAKQLEPDTLGARLWRLRPGQTMTKHRHRTQTELYVVLEGTGRVGIGEEVLRSESRLVRDEPCTVATWYGANPRRWRPVPTT